MFVKKISEKITALIVCVDDIVLIGNDFEEIATVKHTLQSNFGIKDLGILKYFLGLEVAHSSKGISLCQRQYCIDLLVESGMLESKLVSTPHEPGTHLYQDGSPLYTDIVGYERLIGRLLYLTTTLLDITFATRQLIQFVS